MAAPINSYIKLRDIVYLYMEQSKKTDAEFIRYWRLCFRGFIQMGLNAFWQIKEIVIPVQPNQTAYLPNDYIQWIRVANFNSNGELQILNVNNQLSTFGDLSDDRMSKIASQIGTVGDILTDGFINYPNCNNDTPFSDGLYGTGSRLLTVSSCKIDDTNRVIILDVNNTLNEVALQYVSSPEQDEDYQIPIQFQEAMIAWLNWQDKMYLPATSKGSAIDKQIAAQNFKSQLLLAKKMFKPVRIGELELIFRESERFCIKG